MRDLASRALADPRLRRLAREAACFLAVGLVSSAVYSGLTVGLVERAGWGEVAAAALAFVAGTLVSYAGNSLLSFRRAPDAAALLRFFAVAGVGMGLNLGLVRGATALGLDYRLGILAVLFLVPVFNFAGHKLFTFR